MVSDDDIDVLPGDDDAQLEAEQPRPRKSIGFKSLLAGMIIAAVGGAAGGTFLSQLTSPAPLPAVKTDLSVVNSSLDALARDNKALKSQLSKLQKQSAPAPVDLAPLLARLGALENAAQIASQNAPEPVVDEALIKRLEALQGEGSPALDLTDITQRLAALETAGPDEQTRDALQDLYERQGELFIQIEDALVDEPKTVLGVDAPAKVTAAPLPAFPEDELRAALEGMNKSQGWAKRTLNKHIAVRSEDDPESLIAGIKLDLEKRDVVAAASKFDSLPPQLRAAGQAWRSALKP